MLRYTKIRFYEKMARTLVNIRKIEVILIYAKKNKSPHGLPRQYFPKLKKACKMGVSGAKEVKFTTGLPLLQEEKIK